MTEEDTNPDVTRDPVTGRLTIRRSGRPVRLLPQWRVGTDGADAA